MLREELTRKEHKLAAQARRLQQIDIELSQKEQVITSEHTQIHHGIQRVISYSLNECRAYLIVQLKRSNSSVASYRAIPQKTRHCSLTRWMRSTWVIPAVKTWSDGSLTSTLQNIVATICSLVDEKCEARARLMEVRNRQRTDINIYSLIPSIDGLAHLFNRV